MQNRYAGDVGDYVKLSLLRALTRGRKLGIAWYLYPDEDHNSDGRHTSYLRQPEKWRCLDPELFDALSALVLSERSIAALEPCLHGGRFASAQLPTAVMPAERCVARSNWFKAVSDELADCDIVFADPDNGLVDDAAYRRRNRTFGKQMPLSEAIALSQKRVAVIYHHNTRFKGGHDAEVDHWIAQLGRRAIAVRATAYSCRTFFIINPDEEIVKRAEAFCERWRGHRVRMHARAGV